jgi:hypothetical protein
MVDSKHAHSILPVADREIPHDGERWLGLSGGDPTVDVDGERRFYAKWIVACPSAKPRQGHAGRAQVTAVPIWERDAQTSPCANATPGA